MCRRHPLRLASNWPATRTAVQRAQRILNPNAVLVTVPRALPHNVQRDYFDLAWKPYHRHPRDTDLEHAQKRKIYSSLRGRTWAKSAGANNGPRWRRSHEHAEKQGISWLELFILYDSAGGAPNTPNHRLALKLAAKTHKTGEDRKQLRMILRRI